MLATTNHFEGMTLGPRFSTERRRRQTQRWLPKADTVLYWASAIAPWGLALLLLGVSMPHLAHGLMTICHVGPLSGWLLAIAIDASQVAAKVQITMARRYGLGTAAKWTAVGIITGTSLMSMSLNTLGFLAGATDKMGTALSWVAGITIPLLVIGLSYTGTSFALAKKKREMKAKGRGSR